MTTTEIYLTGYIIKANEDEVGEILSRIGPIQSVKISGRDADDFAVTRSNILKVKRGKLPAGKSRFEIVVAVVTAAGKYSGAFTILKDEFVRNKVVAHRGAWKNTSVPENSIASFQQAVRLGCEGSEFDVHMTADSLPVVNHDASIQGTSIARTPSSILLKKTLSNGEPIPTLESYIKAGMDQRQTKLILEIKSSELGKEGSIALTRKIVELVERMQAQAWTDYIAFDYDVCKEVMRLAPYAKVAYLNGDKTPQELGDNRFFGLDYNIRVIEKNSAWIAEAHSRNLTVNVWTVNDEDVMKKLLSQRVDFITTNEPERLLELIKK